jgi:hypothetical protein
MDFLKQAMLHPQLEIRQRALRYFSVCHSDDERVVPLVIQAVKRYGREDAYHLVGSSVDLRHTKETVSWVIEELQDPAAERYENYVFNLNRVLCHADPALLIHRDTEILESGHFYRDMRDHFTRRLELLSWDEAACWRQLEQICEDGKDKRYVNEAPGRQRCRYRKDPAHRGPLAPIRSGQRAIRRQRGGRRNAHSRVSQAVRCPVGGQNLTNTEIPPIVPAPRSPR